MAFDARSLEEERNEQRRERQCGGEAGNRGERDRYGPRARLHRDTRWLPSASTHAPPSALNDRGVATYGYIPALPGLPISCRIRNLDFQVTSPQRPQTTIRVQVGTAPAGAPCVSNVLLGRRRDTRWLLEAGRRREEIHPQPLGPASSHVSKKEHWGN